ncbi:hypothetical protein [Streptomyces sp. NPDC087300]|uniref:hypothetical protein n=1 Tax=Streptomyces sp. NPDC087300 TaxID=3365780 RepID=UPI00381782CC
MSLSQMLLAVLLAVVVLLVVTGAAVAVHRRPSLQAPLATAISAVTMVAAVLTVLVTASR